MRTSSSTATSTSTPSAIANGNGNQVSINISWRLSRGSKHKAAEKRINLRDTDNGIIK